ncbi:hypothetical protein PHYSODRAFT_320210 [Phytophthora sojae]|uniref:Copine C-terminal domain-containing protein n=1 Tax=Phytophthora sojae (strain P6497) TaxID=1094619 RepID=G5AHC1_PHYSP|nr:hypothetical protein PHYSODRAFT_320210 [Phytophthora sojae]EGZ05099.1 hypothetical protein PHYSODRAFT_320210 [Phytophthora sojae]|eukprot:XP_009539471.1 hypothetical protein PHYSODRAFT_320210 [Phytophthora sojae]
MGCASSAERQGAWRDTTFQSLISVLTAIRLTTLGELQGVLRWSGLRSTNLIIGVDFTHSNMWNGKQSFGQRCLHFIDPEGLILNPYQVVINIIGRTLLSRKSKRAIHVFGFGDARTADRCVFTFLPDGSPCRGVGHVLKQYKEIAPGLVLGGPTNFAPVIYQAIRQVKATGTCSILVIIAEMEPYPTTLPKRRFDNFRFVNLNNLMSANPEQPALGFATAALAHIPDQLAEIRRLGLLQPTVS